MNLENSGVGPAVAMAELPKKESPMFRHSDGRIGWMKKNQFVMVTDKGERSIDNQFITEEMLMRSGWSKE